MARTAGAVVLREDMVAQCGALESKQGEEGNHTVGQPAIGKSEAEQSEKVSKGDSLERGVRAQQGAAGIWTLRTWGQRSGSVCIQGYEIVIYKKHIFFLSSSFWQSS